jgi:hypothetical protein
MNFMINYFWQIGFCISCGKTITGRKFIQVDLPLVSLMVDWYYPKILNVEKSDRREEGEIKP